MKKQNKSAFDLDNLRQEAETLVKNMLAEPHIELSEVEAPKLIHELQVHQIKLEMQNDALRLAKLEAEVVSQKYAELYDFAPTGYFTFSRECEIIELNQCRSQILGKERWLNIF